MMLKIFLEKLNQFAKWITSDIPSDFTIEDPEYLDRKKADKN